MPRDLDAVQNSLTIRDSISGDEIKFFYRTPTSSEIQAYSSASIKRKGNKVLVNPVQPKLKYGLDILLDVRGGDLIYQGKPLTAAVEGWKNILKEKASDLIIVFAAQVFDGSRVSLTEDDMEVVSNEEAAEDVVPFPKS